MTSGPSATDSRPTPPSARLSSARLSSTSLRGTSPSSLPHRIGAKRRARVVIAAAGGSVALLVVAWLSLAVGAQPIDPATVWAALSAYDPENSQHVVVVTLRIPRTVAGLVAGAAFGVAGAIMQGLTRNPLADPGLLGVNGGASVAVVLTIALLGITSPAALVWFAMAGAAIALGVVLAISVLRPDRSSDAVVPIAGMALTTLCTAVVSVVLLSDRATLSTFRHWQVGSLAGRELEPIWQLAPVLLLGAVLAVVSGPLLNLLALGDDVARGLGARLGVARTVSLVSIVLLCGSAVSIAGPIAFVGLVVPHVVRGVTGPDVTLNIIGSAIGGPIMLLAADIIGRVIVPPGELEAGIVVALVGAPALVLYAQRLSARRRSRSAAATSGATGEAAAMLVANPGRSR